MIVTFSICLGHSLQMKTFETQALKFLSHIVLFLTGVIEYDIGRSKLSQKVKERTSRAMTDLVKYEWFWFIKTSFSRYPNSLDFLYPWGLE